MSCEGLDTAINSLLALSVLHASVRVDARGASTIGSILPKSHISLLHIIGEGSCHLVQKISLA